MKFACVISLCGDCCLCRIFVFDFQSQDVDISKLAMKFSWGIEEVATTLVSTASIANLRKNIATVTEELDNTEKQVMDFVIEK